MSNGPQEKAAPGAVVPSGSLITPGGATGSQGVQGVAGPNAVSTDAGNVATLGSDSKIYVPDPTQTITSVRLRTFNAIGNPNFEITQRNCGQVLTNPTASVFIEDRWYANKGSSTLGYTIQRTSDGMGGPVLVPGTNFAISPSFLRLTLTTAEPTLLAADVWNVGTNIEGPMWRELMSDVHSISLLVRSTVAGVKFSLALRDSSPSKTLVKLCTIPSANNWTLIPLANLPIWPTGANFSWGVGGVGYVLSIVLACGTTYMAPAADTWQNGNFLGAPGMSNFAASPVNSTFDIAFVQHEPGAVCTTLMDCPFDTNLAACQRYFNKSYDYATKPGTVAANGYQRINVNGGSNPAFYYVPFKRTMAKVPTITAYSSTSGTAGTVRDETAAVDKTVTGVNVAGDSGFTGLLVSSPNGAAWGCSYQWTADTGW